MGRGPVPAEQVVANAGELGQNGAEVLAPWCQFDAEEEFNCVVPGDFIRHRADVVHPVDDGHILIEVEIFTEFFEPGVKVTDIRHGFDDGLTIEGQDQSERGVRSRVLRAEVEREQVLLLRPGLVGRCPLISSEHKYLNTAARSEIRINTINNTPAIQKSCHFYRVASVF